MFVFQLLDLNHAIILELGKILFPISVELLHLFVTDFYVLSQLIVLNIRSEIILEHAYVSFEQSDFSHEIFVKLILLNVAELLGENLHLLLDN